jgi:hypothetical protein
MVWWDCYIWIYPTLKYNFNISQSFCFWVGCCIHLCKMHLFETVSKRDTSCIYCVQSYRSFSEEITIIRSLGIDKRQFLHKMGEVGVWEIRNSSANKNSVWQGSRRERNTIKLTIPLISECSLCLVMTKWWTQTVNPKCLIEGLGHHPQSHHWKIQRRPYESSDSHQPLLATWPWLMDIALKDFVCSHFTYQLAAFSFGLPNWNLISVSLQRRIMSAA